jgi:hypothetical protein
VDTEGAPNYKKIDMSFAEIAGKDQETPVRSASFFPFFTRFARGILLRD